MGPNIALVRSVASEMIRKDERVGTGECRCVLKGSRDPEFALDEPGNASEVIRV